jgi:hypothetical protein
MSDPKPSNVEVLCEQLLYKERTIANKQRFFGLSVRIHTPPKMDRTWTKFWAQTRTRKDRTSVRIKVVSCVIAVGRAVLIGLAFSVGRPLRFNLLPTLFQLHLSVVQATEACGSASSTPFHDNFRTDISLP